MKKKIFFLSLALIYGLNGFSQDWKLTWSDEFNYSGLPNPANWDYKSGEVYNNEKQFYTIAKSENARVEDGMLIIEAHAEKNKEVSYTSARLITFGKKDFLFGRIEVRAKLPTGIGTWPAIWMLGINRAEIGWPDCGEIDIMENVGYDPDTIHGNIHTKAYNHIKKTNKGAKIKVSHPYEDFHIYVIEWFEDRIDFYVDSNKYFTFKNEGMGNDVWPFNKPHYLILNIAIGGTWGGRHGIDENIFPQKMLVDYVRYYEIK